MIALACGFGIVAGGLVLAGLVTIATMEVVERFQRWRDVRHGRRVIMGVPFTAPEES